MNCHELAQRIQQFHPNARPRDVARLCLLLANTVEDVDDLRDTSTLSQAWQAMSLRMQAATDQHAAMTEELEQLTTSDPKQLTADQIWVLIRAIRVQGQILQMYVGDPALHA